MMEQVERIRRMEQLFDFALEAMKSLPLTAHSDSQLREAITTLSSYYDSDDWRKDYADDEAGLLPSDLKRGVLSEDGMWNLLSVWQELERESLPNESS